MSTHQPLVGKDLVLNEHFAVEPNFDERENQNDCNQNKAYHFLYMSQDLKIVSIGIKQQKKIWQVKWNEKRDSEDDSVNYTPFYNPLCFLVLIAKYWNENDCDFQIAYGKDQMLCMKQENTERT